MAVTVLLFWVSITLSVIGSDASGEFTVLYSPRSLVFTGSDAASESTLKEIFSASLGLSVEENSKWNGLKITDPFKTPEAVVEVYIDGVSGLGEAVHATRPKYHLIVDEYEPDTYDAMAYRINQRYDGGNNNLVNIKLSNAKELSSYSDVFGDTIVPKMPKETTYHHLKLNVPEDVKFLIELQALRDLTARVKSGFITADNVVDFYNLRFRSLHNLLDYHGPNSLETKEAKKLLAEELEKLSAAFVKAYDGSVLVTAVTTDVEHTRRPTRSLKAGDDQDSQVQLSPKNPYVNPGNEANQQENSDYQYYPEDYAAIFNIFLWFGIIFVFTLIAIVYAMVDMDPGRDSIIYRMTSTRIKKEN